LFFSWMKQISEQPHVYTSMGAPGHPPVHSHIGTEFVYNSASGKSDVAVGVRHQRHTFSYHVAFHLAPRVDVAVQFQPLQAAPVHIEMSASVPYDGSAEPSVG